MRDSAALDDYLGKTAGALFRLAAEMTAPHRTGAIEPAVRAAGIAYGLTGLMRALPVHAAQGRVDLPADMLLRHGSSPEQILAGQGSKGLAEVLAELHEQREASATILEEQEADLSGLLRDSGDGAGQDQADLGATSFERDHELTVLNHEREKVAQIDRALARIDDGTYGVCESCGNPIGKMRLMAFPRATLCMTCKQREERR